MDEDYVMFLAGGHDDGGAAVAAVAAGGAAGRRAAAMAQWNALRAEEEYRLARAALRGAPDPGAWRRFADRHRDALARTLRVGDGEFISAEGPLAPTLGDKLAGLAPDAALPLVAALAAADRDRLAADLQAHDPLSWHCWAAGAVSQNQQRFAYQDWAAFADHPRPRSPPPAARRRRPENAADPEHHRVLRTGALRIRVDTLAWPPRRTVTAAPDVA